LLPWCADFPDHWPALLAVEHKPPHDEARKAITDRIASAIQIQPGENRQRRFQSNASERLYAASGRGVSSDQRRLAARDG